MTVSSTGQEFGAMINQYLPNDLLIEDFTKQDYTLNRIDKDEGWLGGDLIVPFEGAYASSIQFGGLTAQTDVSVHKYVRGSVDEHKELWGTMKFNQKDLMLNKKISEQNFLKMLPGQIESFMKFMKMVVSVNFMVGDHFATLTSDATANDGLIIVDRPDRFTIGQKVLVDDANSAPVTAYVSTINRNTKTVLLVTARGGATPADFAAVPMTVAQSAKCYHPRTDADDYFMSFREALLSSTNGGSSTLYGVTKTTHPYTQAINISGATATADNLMEIIFDGLTEVSILGEGMPTEAIMSLRNFGYCIKAIEAQKGNFNVEVDSRKASQYGWRELTVGSVTGALVKLVGVKEADDDVIFLIDWRGIKFYSNGLFQKRVSPDGDEFFEVRETTGYFYIVDIALMGELIFTRPSYQGVIFGIDI